VERIIAPEKQFEFVALDIESNDMYALVVSDYRDRPRHLLLGHAVEPDRLGEIWVNQRLPHLSKTALEPLRWQCRTHKTGVTRRRHRIAIKLLVNLHTELREIYHPTLPSREIATSFWASTANSIGSFCMTSRTKPLTSSATASSCDRPRCWA